MRSAARLFIFTVVSVTAGMCAAGPSSFPALDHWAAAINSGDAEALRQTYGLAVTQMGVDKVQPEVAFWASLKSNGVTAVEPKILSIKQQNGRAVLVLRVYATKGGQRYVDGMAQLWQQTPGGWQLLSWQRSSNFSPDQGRRLPEPAKPNTALYAPPSEARDELKAALAKAGAEHKRVLAVFGANWCYDCHVLDTTFHSASFAGLVNKNYVVVHINVGDEGKDNNDLAASYGVALDKGVPNLAVLSPDGKVVVAQHGEFQSTTKIGPTEVRAFLEKWKPSAH